MEQHLTHETFSKYLNSKFQVHLDQVNLVELELAQVSKPKRYPEQEQFAVIFHGPVEVFLGQGLRTFKHEQMGQFDLFIVPIMQDEKGFHYEAVFNRLTTT